MMSTDVTPTERATAVLQTLQQALGGMAAAIPEPALAGPLGYFADAAGWAFHSLQAAERWQANEKILDELTGQARGLLEQAGHPLPAGDPDDVAATLDALVGASTAVPEAGTLINKLLAAAAHVETGRPAGPQDIPSGPAATAGLSTAQVEAYLGPRFDGDVAVESVTTIGGGFSKCTILVAAIVAGERREFVLRQVPPGQPDDSLAPEYAVLRHVWTPDLPIAEPLWLEETDALGGPFFASRKATGTTYGTVEGAHKAVPESFCHDLSGFLARLHS